MLGPFVVYGCDTSGWRLKASYDGFRVHPAGKTALAVEFQGSNPKP